MTRAHEKGNLRGRQARETAARECDDVAFHLERSCSFCYWRTTGEKEWEISAFDQSRTNPVVRALLIAVSIHTFDLFLVSSHATRRVSNSSYLQGEALHGIHMLLEWVLHLYATAGGLKVGSLIPFVFRFNKPPAPGGTSHIEKFLAFFTKFHSWRSKLSCTWQQHACLVPHVSILQLLPWRKGYLTEKNVPTKILVHFLFSVFEMLSWLHKTYSFKTLDFNDIKKHWASCHHITNGSLRAKPMRVWIHQD